MSNSSDATGAVSLSSRRVSEPQHNPSFIGRLFGFFGWVFTGFGVLGFVRRQPKTNAEEVIIYAVPQSFYLWLLLGTGFIAAACVHHWPHSGGVFGWIYIWVLMYTLVSVLFDISTIKFLFWVGLFSFIWLACKYVQELHNIPVLTFVSGYFAGLHPTLSVGFATVISWLILPAWVGSLFATFSRGRKTFSPNSIEEWYLGEGCEITDRAGLKFRTRYRDVFEAVLGLGSGDLEAFDGTGKVVKQWDNILFLYFLWPKLDEVLHQRAAVVDNAPSDPVEVREAPRG